MRNIALALTLLAVISCGKTESPQQIEVSEPTKDAVAEKHGDRTLPGLALIHGSDCLSCHKDNGKFVGPSYAEISEKYSEKDIEMLADKIIEGGVGNWGQVPMAPHPQISKDDAKKMVQYILSLK